MSDQVHYHRGVNRSETMVFEEPCGPHDSIPETLIPKGNKSRVLGVGLESNYTENAGWRCWWRGVSHRICRNQHGLLP